MRWQSELKVGILVVGAIIILAILLTMASDWNIATPGEEATFHFDNLNDLKRGAAIHLAGVFVGKVTDVQLREDGLGAVVKGRVNAPVVIREGVTAELSMLGMIGEAYIALRNGPPTNPPYDWSHPIEGTSPAAIASLIEKVDQALSQVSALVATAQETLETSRAELLSTAAAVRDMTGGTLRNLDSFVARMNPILTRAARLADLAEKRLPAVLDHADQVLTRTDGEIDAIGGDARELAADARAWIGDTRRDTNQLLADVSKGVRETRDLLNTLSDEAKSLRQDVSQAAQTTTQTITDEKARLNETLAKLDEGIAQATTLAARLGTIADRVEHGDGTISRLLSQEDTILPKVEDTLTETTAALRRLNALSESVERLAAPERPPLANVGFELTYRSTVEGLQSELGVQVRPDKRRELLAGVSSREGKRVYNVVVGQKVGPVVGRAGFIESKGALGADWTPHRFLTLRAEAIGITRRLFRDNETVLPRIDAKAIIKPLPQAYVVFGAENVINDDVGFMFGVRTPY